MLLHLKNAFRNVEKNVILLINNFVLLKKIMFSEKKRKRFRDYSMSYSSVRRRMSRWLLNDQYSAEKQ